jgi:hypothetical protein
MRAILPRFLNAAVLCAALVAPVAIARTAMSAEELKEGDQQAYWTWRHEHSDEQLKARDH